MRIPVQRKARASSATVRGGGAAALVVGAALFSSVCHADDITYGYDALGRLTAVSVAGANAYYDYDAAGNITAIRRQGTLSVAIPVSGAGSSPAPDAGNPALLPISTQANAR